MLARLVEKSLVDASTSAAARAPLPAARDRPAVRARAARRRRAEATALADRHAHWALALAERERDRPGSTARRRTCAPRSTRCSAARPQDALRLCVALLPFWLRRIDLREGRRRLDGRARRRRGAHVVAAEALLAAAAIDFRAGALPDGLTFVDEALAAALELCEARDEWRVRHRLTDFSVAGDDGEGAVNAVEAARALARRQGLAGAEAVGVDALGCVSWLVWRDWIGPTSNLPRAASSFAGVPELQVRAVGAHSAAGTSVETAIYRPAVLTLLRSRLAPARACAAAATAARPSPLPSRRSARRSVAERLRADRPPPPPTSRRRARACGRRRSHPSHPAALAPSRRRGTAPSCPHVRRASVARRRVRGSPQGPGSGSGRPAAPVTGSSCSTRS